MLHVWGSCLGSWPKDRCIMTSRLPITLVDSNCWRLESSSEDGGHFVGRPFFFYQWIAFLWCLRMMRLWWLKKWEGQLKQQPSVKTPCLKSKHQMMVRSSFFIIIFLKKCVLQRFFLFLAKYCLLFIYNSAYKVYYHYVPTKRDWKRKHSRITKVYQTEQMQKQMKWKN